MNANPVLAVVMLLSVAAAQQPKKSMANGVIYGTVFDQDGQPAKDVGLTASPLGVALGTMLPHTKTDDNGKFRFVSLPWWGRYTVFSEDEAAGYSIFSTGTGSNDTKSTQEVTLSPEQPQAEFNLFLPPKAGLLEIHLTNRKTGKSIEAVLVTVMSSDDPKKLIFSTSCPSRRAILIPPERDLLLHVTSGGFREWSKSTGSGMPIHMHSGSHLTLEIELTPLTERR